jgi:hypothetical protein
MDVSIPVTWGANWAWGVPLIVLNSVVHVLGLVFINETVGGAMRGWSIIATSCPCSRSL